MATSNNSIATKQLSNNELALKLSEIHHLVGIALDPETKPEVAEEALCQIHGDSEELAEYFSDNEPKTSKMLWADFLPKIGNSLDVIAA